VASIVWVWVALVSPFEAAVIVGEPTVLSLKRNDRGGRHRHGERGERRRAGGVGRRVERHRAEVEVKLIGVAAAAGTGPLAFCSCAVDGPEQPPATTSARGC